ncbi:hypothetical protein BDV36DRAFT_243487 [Aspergillus pseudocaelatus]|uniref:Uncharacterized protein n=1 Tax=Aspergillus pseudocaelatus TaxID=1825620 RepID=A0ABQ6X258_9EURO|nr:hypothetical protein BDV36DRAFT_243487 [Aspergillus pseudocaelatus]
MRARQASTSYEDDFDITSQVYALEILTNHGCKSTPGILARKEDLQKKTDLVPGGYIVYVLMQYEYNSARNSSGIQNTRCGRKYVKPSKPPGCKLLFSLSRCKF